MEAIQFGNQTEELYKKVRGILNKLTPQKFEQLIEKFMVLPINTEEKLTGVINLIFEKAVDEFRFSKIYANMCIMCSRMEVTKSKDNSEKVNFRKILITRCQTEFESNKAAELDSAKWQEEINNCADPVKKKEMQLQYEEKETLINMKSIGNVRFIGELFRLGMLTPAVMFRCIDHLLSSPEDIALECLCHLLTVVGENLEHCKFRSLNPYFKRMQELAQNKAGSKVSSRVRFMLQDVIELRQGKWVRKSLLWWEEHRPTTIEEIKKERENLESPLALNQLQLWNNRSSDRQDDRRRGNYLSVRGKNADQDCWNPVTRHYNSTRSTGELSTMSAKDPVEREDAEVALCETNNSDETIEEDTVVNDETAEHIVSRPQVRQKKPSRIQQISAAVKELSDLNKNLSSPSSVPCPSDVKEDECDVIGKHVAIQLRKLSAEDMIDANLEIQQVLAKYRKKATSPMSILAPHRSSQIGPLHINTNSDETQTMYAIHTPSDEEEIVILTPSNAEEQSHLH